MKFWKNEIKNMEFFKEGKMQKLKTKWKSEMKKNKFFLFYFFLFKNKSKL